MGHFGDMLKERGIAPEWAERTRTEPDRTEDRDDGTRHFIKRIPEFGNRWLRVVVNVTETPEKPVTAFFDRRLRRQYENQGG
jgi:hypothetical protein